MNGRNDRVRVHAKQCLLRRLVAPTVRSGNSGLLGEFRIESLTCPSKLDTARPTHLTSTGRGCSHQPGHPSQEFHISSAGASRTRALTTGSPAFYQLSYGTGRDFCIMKPYRTDKKGHTLVFVDKIYRPSQVTA